MQAILEDSRAELETTSAPNKKEVVKNFLEAMKKLRHEDITPKDHKAIDEFQSGEYRLSVEERL